MTRATPIPLDREELRNALFRRVEGFLRLALAQLDDAALTEAVEAPTPAETVARVISAAPETGMQTSDYALALLRGAQTRQEAIRLAGGTLSSGEVAELLGISVPAVKQRQRRQGLLSVPLVNGEWGYPARQFAPDGRIRKGIRDVLAAFGPDGDPWSVLTFLVNPHPGIQEEVAMDALDDASATETLAGLARTFGSQGAT